ncbi:stage III sporulation protein AE, partial [Ruminococcus sp.]|uniref:stage III sporulation protein AE n=1 Tax=Ruminococcus sp. TaxID=41978 RepID=UPI003F7F2BE8
MLKKAAVIFLVLAVVLCLSQVTAFAADSQSATQSTANDINSIYDTSDLYNSLSDDVKQSLENIGINGIDGQQISQISFTEVVNEIVKLAGENSAGPLKAVISLTALILICSLLSSYKNSLSSELSSSLGIAAVLCATCTAALPAIRVIADMSAVVKTASAFMLAFVPVMVMIMSST